MKKVSSVLCFNTKLFFIAIVFNISCVSLAAAAKKDTRDTAGETDDLAVEAFAQSLGVDLHEEILTPAQKAEERSRAKMRSVASMLKKYRRTRKADPRMIDLISRFENIKKGIISIRTTFDFYMEKERFEGDFSPETFLYDFNLYLECEEERSDAHDRELVEEAQKTISFLEKQRSSYLSYVRNIRREGKDIDGSEYLLIPVTAGYMEFLKGIQKKFLEESRGREEPQGSTQKRKGKKAKKKKK